MHAASRTATDATSTRSTIAVTTSALSASTTTDATSAVAISSTITVPPTNYTATIAIFSLSCGATPAFHTSLSTTSPATA